MNADGQAVRVCKPKFVEKNLRLRSGVVKDQGGFMLRNLIQHRGDRIGCATARPRGWGRDIKHGDVRFWAGVSGQNVAVITGAG